MDEKNKLFWHYLHSTMTTSQIDKALRMSGLTWEDWRNFCELFKEERTDR